MAGDLRIDYEALPGADLLRFLEDNLVGHALARTGISEWHPVNYFLRNDRGEVLGGCHGHVWGGWLQVRWLWVTESLRGQGHGAALLAAAEAFARERGATAVTLETHSYQAPGLYRRLGYEVFGTLDDYPPGHQKFFLRKKLD